MFWVLAAFGLLVIDRDRGRARLAAAAGTDGEPGSGDPDPRGPKLGIRWLRVAAGVCLGAAVASKWNGVWYILAFGGLVLAWDLGARRAAGFPARLAGVLRSDAKWLPVSFGVVPAVVYIASWIGLVRHALRLRPDRDPPSAPAASTPPPSWRGCSTTSGCSSSGWA